MELEIKHIAPYLPYRLKGILIHDLRSEFEFEDWVNDVQIFSKGSIWEYAGYADDDLSIPLGEGEFSGFLSRNGNSYCCFNSSLKPILRPLSDLTKEIKHNGERFVPIGILCEITTLDYEDNVLSQAEPDGEMHETEIKYLCFEQIQMLFEWHFDCFDLIPAGLAIDINTLAK